MTRLHTHPLPLSSVSKLSLFFSFPVCRRSSLLRGEREGGGQAWSRIKNLALYKSFNTLNGRDSSLRNSDENKGRSTLYNSAIPVRISPQSNDLNGAPTQLVQHSAYRGSSHRRKCRQQSHIQYGLATSLAYPSGEGDGLLLAQIVSTCLRGGYRSVRGSQHSVRFTGISKHTKISCVIAI